MMKRHRSLKKISNRQRMRNADMAVKYALALEEMLASTITARNGLHASLVAVLAQKGGEVTLTPGTLQQLGPTPCGFAIIPGPGDGEITLRVVQEPVDEPLWTPALTSETIDDTIDETIEDANHAKTL